MSYSAAGKGDTYRRVNMEKYNANYDRIFGKKETKDYSKIEDSNNPDINNNK